MYPFKGMYSLDVCPGVGLLDHMVVLFLVIYENFMLFSTVVAAIYIPTNNVGEFPPQAFWPCVTYFS